MSGDDDCMGTDGLPARKGGQYAALKLGWLDEYLRGALTATQGMIGRNYVDLFAGPGLSVVKGTSEETPGGAMVAVSSRGKGKLGRGFDSCHFVNLDPAHDAALRARVGRLPDAELTVPRERIHYWHRDANAAVSDVMQRLPVRDYNFVFADPENARQLPWSTVEALKLQGHQAVDLYVLFPWGMHIRRQMAAQPRVFDDFFGTDAWRDILARHRMFGQRVERARAMRDLYLTQLRRHWVYAQEVLPVNLRGDQNLYWMLFASSHKAGSDICAGAAAAMRKRSHQGELFLL